ncbi:NADH dehydrogenase [ubiquinone] 1 alpha subcomplex subunit 13-like [Haliotis rubra]|uniref:NADH dehydrogenase [ubiquinone] 1 alpha subcomplex subunit 13-like n=1 Tax=Haliotis rubra TaxID=36100 RepID=UPI001EE50460|nr:NADH dehydrogenase [ubiquinone] 1 alpha subcomplex subunit 13-like [Haliotis rubra]
MPSGHAQDMPPQGGYSNIEWAKKFPKSRFSGYTQFGMFIGFTAAAWIAFYFQRRRKEQLSLEMREARLAIVPLLLAEQQRLYLMQLRANRDEENELMKDVPNWKTGTLWGEPVYHNIANRFIMPSSEEFFAHCSYRQKYLAVNEKFKH